MLLSAFPPPTEKTKMASLSPHLLTHPQPGLKDSFPTFIIRACGQFRHIIDRGVRLNAAEFRKSLTA